MLNNTFKYNTIQKAYPPIEVIDKPPLKSFLRNTVEWSITLVAWALWVYLLLPLFNLMMWFFFGKLFYKELIAQQGFNQFIEIFKSMGVYIVFIFILFRAWGYYNYWMFGRNDRRKWVKKVTVEELATQFNIPKDELQNLQQMKEIIWPYSFAISRTENGWLGPKKT